MDIASLGIEVRTDGVNRATQDLNRLSQACDEVDSAAEGVGQSFRQTSQGLGSANAQTRQAAINLRDVGVSARQTQAALRQLPAQFSDIVISLQGGQNPLSVFLQQGSQIKDSFGGVGPALRETARYAAGLINPFTAGAAAVGLLGVAYYQGSKESSAFNKAIISSGNFAGVSAGQLQEMAASIRGVDVTQRQAAAGLAEFTSAGVFTAEQLQSMTAAAIRWEDATGKAVSDTVTEFKKLAADPVKASEDLNRQYNYLTASVYEQISALQAQGKESEAAQVAEKAYADALSERSTNVKESLGTIETAWNDVAKAAKGAWDAALDIGREKTIDEKIAELKQRIKEVAEVGTSGPSGRARYQLGLGPGGSFGSLLSMGANAAMSYFGGGVSASASGSLAAGASQSGYAMDLSNFVAGARAGGGPVSAGSMYQVGENNRPELLTQGGRSYLIPGDGGNVTPIKGGGTNISAQMIFALPNVTNAREAREASGVIARNVARSISGAGRYS